MKSVSRELAMFNLKDEMKLSDSKINLFKKSREFNKCFKIINVLESEGYSCYFVGGCIRDTLLNLKVDDLDLATNCRLDTIIKIFKKHGINVKIKGQEHPVAEIYGVELAEFRIDGEVLGDGKSKVEHTDTPYEDSTRRDLTVNSLYMDKDFIVYDFQGGLEDIRNKVIRTVGDAKTRFEEHSTRILRAIYFKTKLKGFSFAPGLQEVIRENGHICLKVVNEMHGKLLLKVITNGSLYEYMKECMDLGLMRYVYKELAHLYKLPQNPKYHCFDSWEHTLVVLKEAEKALSNSPAFILGALYHDCAKGLPNVRGVNKEGMPNDLGHEEVGSKIAFESLLNYGLGKDLGKEVSLYVKYHGTKLYGVKQAGYIKFVRKVSKEFSNKEDLKRFLTNLVLFISCDAKGFNDTLKEEILSGLGDVHSKLMTVIDENLFYIKELPVNGKDVMDITGFKGKEVGDTLEDLLLMNVNNRQRAISLLEKRKSKVK